MLREQMRMTRGLMNLSNHLYYKGQLVDGPGTDLEKRPLAQAVKVFINSNYPVREEDDYAIHPLLIDVPGMCFKETNGRSLINLRNISVGLSLIEGLLASIPEMPARKIGVAVAYAGQVRQWHSIMRAALEANPKLRLLDIRVGVAEHWQASERAVMIFDFVRAGNERRNVGYMRSLRRLNVLISRQRAGLFIIADLEAIGEMKSWGSRMLA